MHVYRLVFTVYPVIVLVTNLYGPRERQQNFKNCIYNTYVREKGGRVRSVHEKHSVVELPILLIDAIRTLFLP